MSKDTGNEPCPCHPRPVILYVESQRIPLQCACLIAETAAISGVQRAIAERLLAFLENEAVAEEPTDRLKSLWDDFSKLCAEDESQKGAASWESK